MMIIAATDLSDAARRAVDRAMLIARERRAQVTLVHAFDETSWENLRSLATPKKNLFADQPLAQAGEAIRTLAERLEGKQHIRVSGVVKIGRPSEVLASMAEASRASLIVVGPHSNRLSDRLYLGSTALGVARMATCPVLVVRNKSDSEYGRCLAGIDFSPPSERAAVAVARLFPDAEIKLLHAVQSVEGPMLLTGELREAIEAAKAALRRQAMQRLSQMFPGEQPGRLGSARRRTVAAPAARALLRELKGGKFDLLALGRDSRAPLAERVLGSVPANLLVNAPSDVLIVP